MSASETAAAPVLLDVTDGVGTLTLNRPTAMNALDLATKVALLDGLRAVAADDAIRVLVLTGAGRAFCVGQDLKEHIGLLAAGDAETVWRTVPEHYNPIALALAELDKPVVAAVNGVAAGAGASLSFLADLRIVSASAGFNLAFAQVALAADTGASWSLARLVGPTRAMDLLLDPRTISADDALAYGIATEVVSDERFAARIAEVAARLAAGPTVSYGAIRRSVAQASGGTLADALAVEAEMMRRTGATADHRAAVEAFLAKRPPVFTGR